MTLCNSFEYTTMITGYDLYLLACRVPCLNLQGLLTPLTNC